ncbi:MAG TPA: nitronate monooxygenase [Candidatus Limnocylindria bacterium]|jgi:NAD(P)H-dependent flavin oxidoreductase YrpB (nitropropane dioxygenase family)
MLCEFSPVPSAKRIALARDGAAGTPGATGMGFFGHWMANDMETFDLAARSLRVVEVFWASPSRAIVERGHAGGAHVSWQIGSVDEARAAIDAGVDLIVAQGIEAGGHVRGILPLHALLDAVLSLPGVPPVIAAGGIASPRAMAAAIAAGAAGVRVGTLFVATDESTAHADYVRALVAAKSDETVLTTTFSLGWPDAPHRTLASAVAAACALPPDSIVATASDGDGGTTDLARFAVNTPSRWVHGNIAAMALYAGQGVGMVNSVRPAGDVVRELAVGAELLLARNAVTNELSGAHP